MHKESKRKDKLILKTHYAIKKTWDPFYTGGSVEVSKDGNHLLCMCGEDVKVLQVDNGTVVKVLKHDEGEVSCFCVSPDDATIVTATRALLLKQWEWTNDVVCVRTWKSIHTSPIICMDFDPTSTLLATGGSDGTVKVWDLVRRYCTHNFKGSPGIISTLRFHPSNLTLYSAADDYSIRVWNLNTSRCVAIMESHVSAVTCIRFPMDNVMVSGSRDNVVSIWDVPNMPCPRNLKPFKTIPVFESIEDLAILPNDQSYPKMNLESISDDGQFRFITAGSKGALRVWDSKTSACLYNSGKFTTEHDSKNQAGYVHLRLLSSTLLVSVTNDHHLDFLEVDGFNLQKHLVGYNDDVLDVKFLGQNETHMLVVTNSSDLKVFQLSSSACHILRGHTDTVMCVDVFSNKNCFVSCSKDNCVRVWKMDPETFSFTCLAKAEGHTHVVGCVATCKLSTNFFVSGSEDNTLKIWDLKIRESASAKVQVLHTMLAHEKSVNSIAVSPNDKLVATGSQDKLAKLWSSRDGQHLGSFRGHKRGIWCVQFSPMDQVLATSSSDGTVKLWSLVDYSCVKTLEGHDASVLKLIFIVSGTQIITAGSDGLLKLWTIKSSECIQTIDHHTDKVWALCANDNDSIVLSGSADSLIVCLEDVTEKRKAEQDEAHESNVLHHQELQNLVHERRYAKALLLAIKLEQPFTALNVIKEILWEENGVATLEENLLNLRPDQKQALFKFVISWNSNSRNCHEAQVVMRILLSNTSPHEIEKYPNSQSIIESLLPYTDRHFQRLSRIAQQATFLDYTWSVMKMKPHDS